MKFHSFSIVDQNKNFHCIFKSEELDANIFQFITYVKTILGIYYHGTFFENTYKILDSHLYNTNDATW